MGLQKPEQRQSSRQIGQYPSMADIKKQALITSDSSSDDRLNELDNNGPAIRHQAATARNPSTTFAPKKKPKYAGADGRKGGVKPI